MTHRPEPERKNGRQTADTAWRLERRTEYCRPVADWPALSWCARDVRRYPRRRSSIQALAQRYVLTCVPARRKRRARDPQGARRAERRPVATLRPENKLGRGRRVP